MTFAFVLIVVGLAIIAIDVIREVLGA